MFHFVQLKVGRPLCNWHINSNFTTLIYLPVKVKSKIGQKKSLTNLCIIEGLISHPFHVAVVYTQAMSSPHILCRSIKICPRCSALNTLHIGKKLPLCQEILGFYRILEVLQIFNPYFSVQYSQLLIAQGRSKARKTLFSSTDVYRRVLLHSTALISTELKKLCCLLGFSMSFF